MNSGIAAPWLASVGAGRWQLSGIRAARDNGISVLAMDGDPDAPGLAVADSAMVVDIRDPKVVVDAVVASEIQIAGAISFAAEVGMRAVGALRDRFSLPGPRFKVMEQLTDKAKQRHAWEMADLENPRFWRIIEDLQQGYAAISDADEPVIIKPVDSAGSRGVTRLDGDAHKNEQRAALERALSGSQSQRAIVESVLPGREYTVETFADGETTHVLAVTVKKKVANTGDTVANELATPDDPPDVLDAIGKTACQALEAVGYREGPGHVEIMYAAGLAPALIEAAGRGAGFMVFERFVPLTSGYDILAACVAQAIGRQVRYSPATKQAGVIRFFPSKPGRVRAYAGFEQANDCDGVEAGSFVNVGDTMSAAESDGDRLGYILATGPTPGIAHQRADLAESFISFEIAQDV